MYHIFFSKANILDTFFVFNIDFYKKIILYTRFWENSLQVLTFWVYLRKLFENENIMAKIYEKSSWGIVYRKNGNKIEILLLEWLNSKSQVELVIPKGHMEDGETASQTALRETAEETGLLEQDFEIIKFITKLNYTFTAGYLEDTPLIDKDVYLFLIKYKGNQDPIPQKEERFVWFQWCLLEDIKNLEVKFDLPSIIAKNKVYFI